MGRPTLVYIILLAVCAVGVFSIIRIGAGLYATPDLTGTWEVTDLSNPAADVEDDDAKTMSVEQSGRFVQVHFSDGLHLDLKAEAPTPPDAVGTRTVHMAGGKWKFVARFENRDPTQALFRLDGPRKSTFPAKRRSNNQAAPAPGHASNVPTPAPATRPTLTRAS